MYRCICSDSLQVQRVTVVLGALRIFLALATIPLTVECVRKHNSPGDGSYQYMSFYWTDFLVRSATIALCYMYKDALDIDMVL